MSVSYINSTQSAALSNYKGEELSLTTKLRLEALGINASEVKTEAQAQILIAQAQAAPKQNNSGYQNNNSTKQELLAEAKNLAQNTGTNYSEKDELETILQNISNRLNTISENYPEKTEVVKEYQNKLSDIAKRADLIVHIHNHIFNKMDMISVSNRLILGL